MLEICPKCRLEGPSQTLLGHIKAKPPHVHDPNRRQCHSCGYRWFWGCPVKGCRDQYALKFDSDLPVEPVPVDISPAACISAAKILDNIGYLETATLIRALRYAVDHYEERCRKLDGRIGGLEQKMNDLAAFGEQLERELVELAGVDS